ncbi:MAG: PEP-CTERM sorting domain-containing protein [Candidatus Auribacterota bacterium]
MRKYLFGFAIATVVFSVHSISMAVMVKGEAEYISTAYGRSNYVDYIYTNEGPLVNADSSFQFFYGNADAYNQNGGSEWWYYYQVENFSYTSDDPNVPSLLHIVQAFSFQLAGGLVLSMGYIAGHDMDSSLSFDHNIMGEHEKSWDDSAVNPVKCVLTPGGIAPNVSTDFHDATYDHRLCDDQSAVIFVSSVAPPAFRYSFMQNNDRFIGFLPTPTMPEITIPEPSSLIMMLSAGSCLLMFKRKK